MKAEAEGGRREEEGGRREDEGREIVSFELKRPI